MGTVRTRKDPPPTVPIPQAEYVCKIKAFKPDAVDSQFGKKDMVIFEIVEGPWTGHTASKSFGQSLHPQSKISSLIQTVGLPIVADGQMFDLQALVGRPLIAMIKANVQADRTFNNVEAWRPYFPGSAPQPVPAAAPAPVSPAPAPAPMPPQQMYTPPAPVPPQQPAAYPPGYTPPPAPAYAPPPPPAPVPASQVPPPLPPPPVAGRPQF